MAISFVIGKDFEHASNTEISVDFSEEIHEKLSELADSFEIDIAYLINLNPYDDFEFDGDGRDKILNICNNLKESKNISSNEITEFINELIGLCIEAQKKNLNLFAIGD